MTFATKTTLALAGLLGANAAVLSTRDCASIPSTADPNVLNTVYTTARAHNVSDRVLLATFETAWVESHANNLTCGDQDSVGVFQQRPSQGWGTVAQCTNVTYSATSYLNAAVASDGKYPKYTAGQIAQSVQYSEYPDRYDQAESTAKSLIAQAQSQLGLPISTPALSASTSSAVPVASSSGSTMVTNTVTVTPTTTSGAYSTASKTASITSSASASKSSSSTKAATSTKTSSTSKVNGSTTSSVTHSSTSSPKPSSTLAPGSLDSTCGAFYDVASGDSCSGLEQMYGATLKQLRFWNPSINAACTNLVAGYIYCVSSQVAVPPSYAASGIDEKSCTGYTSKVANGQTCSTLSKKYGVSQTRLVQLNKSLNSKCSNIVVGKAYCITSIGS